MGKRIIEIIKNILDEILDIIYPPDNKCICCSTEDFVGVCTMCSMKIKRVHENGDIISYGYYGGVLKKIILELKYKKNFLAGKILGDYLTILIKENNIESDIILYVPMSKKSIKKRGYNQSRIMAEVISSNLGIKVSHNFIKIKETKEQKTLTKEERKTNICGVFDLKNKKEIIGKKIILIDDVATTGMTMKECEKTLKSYGACSINLLTVAKSDI